MSENEYIPRFERDLQRAGSGLEPFFSEPAAEEPAAVESVASENAEDELPNIDYVYGNEDYDPNAAPAKTYADLMDAENSGGRVRLSEMGTPRRTPSESLRAQMMADDMALSMGDRPTLQEMSERYGSGRNDLDDLIAKNMLDRNEKEALKNRMKAEISARPQGFNQKRSLEMYHQLMDEQDAKEAQKGFVLLLMLAGAGLATAALEYFLKLNPDGSLSRIYFDYIHFATIIFSVLMLVKAKFFKILSIIYFIANSVALVGPGLMVYAMDPVNQEGGESGAFIIKITLFLLAIIFSVVITIRLIKDKTIAAYYSYSKRK